jgi:diadenylate cyclase
MSFLDFRFLDLIDILLVAFLLYQLYRLIKDTVAINVLIGVAAIYVIWKLVGLLEMELLSEILGKFIGVGVIALVIVFQQEIREDDEIDYRDEDIIKACESFSKTHTGALIVIEGDSKLGFYSSTGTSIKAEISINLLESIFNKYSPLHDGAVIISGNTIVAAGCILPLTEKTSLPSRFGLRHRAAMGISEKTNALTIIVSEETGDISTVHGENFQHKLSSMALRAILKEFHQN